LRCIASRQSIKLMELRGSTAIVTGASRGIGRAVAEALCARGARLVLNYLSNDAAASETDKRLVGCDRVWVRGDVADPSTAERLVDEALRRFGRVDVLVNNAGILVSKPLLSMGVDEWRRVIDVDLNAPFYLIRAALPHMVARRRGVIVNIASVLGINPEAEAAAYSAAKAGLIALTKALARELRGSGVRVVAVAPGGVDTDMARAWGALDWVEEEVPLGRLADPGEIASVVIHVIEVDYYHGDVVTVSGGLLR